MIRRAVAEDEASIKDCARQAYAPYVHLIGQKPAPMAADFRTQIQNGAIYVTTDDSGVLQGFIVFYPEVHYMLLENVAVFPVATGRGVGKTLIRFCEEEAQRRGLSAVHLYTNEMMVENIKMYVRLGYAEVARRKENGFARVFFEKSLG